jgi:hypothetical protein
MKKLAKLSAILTLLTIALTACEVLKPKKVDVRNRPDNAIDRAKKNVDEGRGVSLKGIIKGRGGNTFEFSTSNPMWRASLDILDFLPLVTVDYAGGLIISDWYSDSSGENNSLKVTVRFLTNQIQSNSLKVSVHKKVCSKNGSCNVRLIKSKISEELSKSIIVKAAELEKSDKLKK